MSKRTTLRHADWLALVDPSGPFLTLPVLRRVWPDGLDRTLPERSVELRERVEELGAGEAERRAFVDWVMRTLLSFGPTIREGPAISDTLVAPLAEHGVLLRPDMVVVDPSTETARLLVSLWTPGTDFAGHVAGEGWAASPIDRMATLCRRVGVELGLVTDGDQFTMIWAPHSGPIGRATWVASVFAEAAERGLLDAFTSVLGAKRFFSVGPKDRIEALLAESATAQSDVTGQLGIQVRRAVELLVAAFSRANAERGGQLLSGLDPRIVYEAACIVMMRLVFLLSAEERRLLPLGDELYDRSYAVSTLRQSLREVADAIGNDETLEHSFTAWPRLLATFRAVHGGLSHDQLRLPAYSGRLFDPDRYPFLEGRQAGTSWRDATATPIPVDDRTMLGMLTAVQILQMREGGVIEARRLSFRSLDVEQIGHVYEGLLDHGALRVDEVTLGLVGKSGYEEEVTLAEVQRQATLGSDGLVAFFVEQTMRSDTQVREALFRPIDDTHARRLRVACDNDASVFEGVKPYLWLLRNDVRELPMVLLPGYVHVTEVSHRRDTGTEYTTKELADEVVRYALEPLVYSPGPAEGAEPEDWKLKSSSAILDLRVCDPAVGSGAIITAACRYLSERLVEAWAAEGLDSSPGGDGNDDLDDVLIAARRRVAERCLYGVDRDPMAVEMAKLSLWLITMARDRPFSFLDHAFCPGDSLLGVTRLEQVQRFNLEPEAAAVPMNFTPDIEPFVKEALDKRRLLEEAPVIDVRDAEEKARLLAEADDAMRTVKVLADLVVGAALSTAGKAKNDHNTRLGGVTGLVKQALLASDSEREIAMVGLHDQAEAWLNERRPDSTPLRHPMHWPLAFPEVFLNEERNGFDAMVGNPPFQGGTKISGSAGGDYRSFIAEFVAERVTNRADLVAFFFLRSLEVTGTHSCIGLLATNSISQGDTREAALDNLEDRGDCIYRAVKSVPWPGSATLEIAKVWIGPVSWSGPFVLDDKVVTGIDSSLEPRGRSKWIPLPLAQNKARTFEGSKPQGMGFVLSPTEAEELLTVDPANRDVVMPYINGEDVNSRSDSSASRWIINFHDWTLERAQEYPACFKIVEELVKPEREGMKADHYKVRWWQYLRTRPALREAIQNLSRVLAMPRVSKTLAPTFLPTGMVYSEALVIFAFDDDEHFGLLTSSFHYWWAITRASTMRTDLRYTPTDCFDTFPQPILTEAIGAVGHRLDLHRRQLMLDRSQGLTASYNQFHSASESGSDIQNLRGLHMELDNSVAAAYGWTDLSLGHEFYETRQGSRFTLHPEARVEILDRLLELNHERHEAEGGPFAARTKRARGRKAVPLRPEHVSERLFNDDDFSGDA